MVEQADVGKDGRLDIGGFEPGGGDGPKIGSERPLGDGDEEDFDVVAGVAANDLPVGFGLGWENRLK